MKATNNIRIFKNRFQQMPRPGRIHLRSMSLIQGLGSYLGPTTTFLRDCVFGSESYSHSFCNAVSKKKKKMKTKKKKKRQLPLTMPLSCWVIHSRPLLSFSNVQRTLFLMLKTEGKISFSQNINLQILAHGKHLYCVQEKKGRAPIKTALVTK